MMPLYRTPLGTLTQWDGPPEIAEARGWVPQADSIEHVDAPNDPHTELAGFVGHDDEAE